MSQIWGNLGARTWQMAAMWIIGGVMIYLAICKEMEPTLLLPMGFGCILCNLPNSGAVEVLETLLAEHGPERSARDDGPGRP